MNGRIIIYPYKIASASSRELAKALQRKHDHKIFRVYPNRRYRNRNSDAVVNWGSTEIPTWNHTSIINRPEAVALAVNKLLTFRTLQEKEVRTVPWTTDINVAREWVQICERHRLTGRGGQGIRLSTPDTIQDAPLYTMYLSPSDEYRVHVFKGKVIDYTKKVKRTEDGIIQRSDEIKNKANGWEYIRDVSPRSGVIKRATQAVGALGLDFGSVDVLRYKGRSYVLEVGTAPGLSPLGVEAYANAILSLNE